MVVECFLCIITEFHPIPIRFNPPNTFDGLWGRIDPIAMKIATRKRIEMISGTKRRLEAKSPKKKAKTGDDGIRKQNI